MPDPSNSFVIKSETLFLHVVFVLKYLNDYECICTSLCLVLSYTRSRPARKDAANQNLLRQNFIAYIFRSKSARARAQEHKSFIAYIFRSKKQEPEQESKRENGETPSPFRRIILRLGRITPWLAAAHRPSCRHGEGRAHVVENYPWHMRRLFFYHLEHRMSAPSCNSECEGGFLHLKCLIPCPTVLPSIVIELKSYVLYLENHEWVLEKPWCRAHVPDQSRNKGLQMEPAQTGRLPWQQYETDSAINLYSILRTSHSKNLPCVNFLSWYPD